MHDMSPSHQQSMCQNVEKQPSSCHFGTSFSSSDKKMHTNMSFTVIKFAFPIFLPIFAPSNLINSENDVMMKRMFLLTAMSMAVLTGMAQLNPYIVKTKGVKPVVMNGIDVIVTDIQDVGLRFYTYYVTMINLMDAAVTYDKQFMVLDRPNPNGMYVDGPILDMTLKSGVGRLPIPTVHGMTLGELAQMANGEGWLKDGKKCELTVIPCENYTHQTRYKLPIAPSPNLPDMLSIYLYPSMCYFEGTTVSLGRGTPWPFQVYGHPAMTKREFEFTPRSVDGAKNPPQLDNLCHGVDLHNMDPEQAIAQGINLEYVIDAYNDLTSHGQEFYLNKANFFDKLMGTTRVREMIAQGKTAREIKATWQGDVYRFKQERRPYLIYKE